MIFSHTYTNAFHHLVVSMSSLLLILMYNFLLLSDIANYNSILICDFEFLTRYCLFSGDYYGVNSYTFLFFPIWMPSFLSSCASKKQQPTVSLHFLIEFHLKVSKFQSQYTNTKRIIISANSFLEFCRFYCENPVYFVYLV